ncbi:hypothetical protein [Goodfellowiella coeruleoviolacea]|nr:hypothetical protein [Goodfellowiella coeruleoviolacea]
MPHDPALADRYGVPVRLDNGIWRVIAPADLVVVRPRRHADRAGADTTGAGNTGAGNTGAGSGDGAGPVRG